MNWFFALISIPVIYSIVRRLLTVGVLRLMLGFRGNRNAVFSIFVGTAIISCVVAIAATRQIVLVVGLSALTSASLLPGALVVCCVALYRWRTSANPLTPDAEVYHSDWKPDPSRSDEWNLTERLYLDRLAKGATAIGTVIGVFIPILLA